MDTGVCLFMVRVNKRKPCNVVFSDLQSIRRLLESETTSSDGDTCPSCQMPFDKGKKRKLIDTCGHERCYSCMFKNEQCPTCNSGQKSFQSTNTSGNNGKYDWYANIFLFGGMF